MKSKRLIRLAQTILKVKTQPHQSRKQCLQTLRIAKSQFYRDLQSLSGLGLSLKYSSHEKAFIIKEEPSFSINDLRLTDIMALMLSVRQQVLKAENDFPLAYGAYAALCHIIAALPSRPQRELTLMVDKLVARDGFGCAKDTLDKLQEALVGRNRILIDYQEEDGKTLCRYTADPERLYLKHGLLFLDAFIPKNNKTESFFASRIKRVIETPFLIPR